MKKGPTPPNSLFIDYQRIVRSGLFDADFYRRAHAEILTDDIDPLMHYLERGAADGRNPSALFDTMHYLEQCRARGERPANPLLHYIETGAALGLTPVLEHQAIRFWLEGPTVIDGHARPAPGVSIRIHGWAVATAGIATIAIMVNGVKVSTAEYRRRREDVADALPDFSDAPQSGFEAEIPCAAVGAGRQPVSIIFCDKLGREARYDFTVEVAAPSTDGPLAIRRHITDAELALGRNCLAALDLRPHFYWLLFTGSDPSATEWACQSLASLRDQVYPDWRVIVVPRAHANLPQELAARVAAMLGARMNSVSLLPHYDANAVLDELKNDPNRPAFFGVLSAGDELGSDALMEFAIAAGLCPHSKFLYADEERKNLGTGAYQPILKQCPSADRPILPDTIGRPWCIAADHVLRHEAELIALAEEPDSYFIAATMPDVACVRHVPLVLARRSPDLSASATPGRSLAEAAQRRLRVRAYAEMQKPIPTVARARTSLSEVQMSRFLSLQLLKRPPGYPVPARLHLAFTRPEHPLVSIIIPVFNHVDFTNRCLASISVAATETSFEIIVIDDASTDETKLLARDSTGLVVLRNDANVGFVESCNRGAASARGDYLCFLNNDTEVTNGWLDEMIVPYRQDLKTGIVGAKLVYPDGCLQEAGGIVWKDGAASNFGRGDDPLRPEYCYLRDVDYVSGAALMVDATLFKTLGGFSNALKPAYYEDTDLAFRARAIGRRVLYQPFAQVVHFEGVTSGTDPSGGAKLAQPINRLKFAAEWQTTLASYDEKGANPLRIKDRYASAHMVAIDALMPRPDEDAGSHAAIQEMLLARSLGLKVTFIAEYLDYDPRRARVLQEAGIECIYPPYYRTFEAFLAERGSEFDIAYITRHYVARHALEPLRRHAPRARIILNTADLHYLRELRAAKIQGSPEALHRALNTKREELAVISDVDLTLVYNTVERTILFSEVPQAKVLLCPWVARSPTTIRTSPNAMDIVFLGGFGHPPNVDAVQHFVRHVWPAVATELPEARFLIYGSKVSEVVKNLTGDRVEVRGYIENLDDAYGKARVFVSPLRYGAGLKGKVVDALSWGVPSVLSSVSAEGMDLRDGVEAFISDDDDEFAQHVIRLCRDDSTWRRMSKAARTFALRHYSFTAGREAFASILRDCGVITPTS